MSAARNLKDDAERIGNIAARMDSPHDGEVLNAARITVRCLKDMGLQVGDVVRDGIPSPASVVFRTYAPPPVSPLRSWQRAAWEALARADDLTEWERSFLKTMKERRSEPTDKQAPILADILARVRAARDRAERSE